jgi:ribosomal protein L11 methyltransferase
MEEEIRRIRLAALDPVEREWLLAEAFEAGASGAEENDDRYDPGDGPRAIVYATPERAEAVRAALLSVAPATATIGPVERLDAIDWSEAWKEGLEALEVSPRLVVRPPFVDFAAAPGQREIVIDPGQAFGTGAHASTRLCLEWIDALLVGDEPGPRRPDRVLDVGTGSGVLALAAVALGCERAVGFDLDPVAVEAARVAARRNELADRVDFFTGGIEALSRETPGFPLVVVNLLKREMLPIAESIASRVAPGGRLVLAGLLEEDGDEVLARFAEEGLLRVGMREQTDTIGTWIGPCLARLDTVSTS